MGSYEIEKCEAMKSYILVHAALAHINAPHLHNYALYTKLQCVKVTALMTSCEAALTPRQLLETSTQACVQALPAGRVGRPCAGTPACLGGYDLQ